MDIQDIACSLSPLERTVVQNLGQHNSFEDLVKKSKLKDVEVMRALQWLQNKGVVKVDNFNTKVIVLGENGKKYSQEGMPERKILEALLGGKLSLAKIVEKTKLDYNEVTACIGILTGKIAIQKVVEGKELFLEITEHGKKLLNETSPEEKLVRKIRELGEVKDIDSIKDLEKLAFDNLKKRKDVIKIEEKNSKLIVVEKGIDLDVLKEFSKTEYIESLTPEMIKSGEYKGKKFRAYDVKSQVPAISGGRLHPLQETMNQIRRIFMDMGFQEMEGPLIETAFWCMDSMWIPQNHPARDVQDTFYLPYEGKIPEELAKKVAAVHEYGGKTGSKGYGYKWDEKIAKQLLLRSHTTATTFRYFGEKNIKAPTKYFYIGRIFRNDVIDATHLPEFHHSEGFIMGEGLTLRDLMGYIKEFYNRMGIHKIKFKPTYNPYTEPSMEAIGYNEQLGKWVELINSGIFRPEALEPYGIKVPVIAWGLGVERLAMMVNKQKDIRNMMGTSGDLSWLRKHKIVKQW